MNRFRTLALGLVAVSMFTAGCHMMPSHAKTDETAEQHARILGKINHAVAVMQPTEGNEARGTVHFYEEGDHVRVVVDIEGLRPNQDHGFHVHEFGDMTSADGTAAGGHYNPEGHQHGRFTAGKRHAGDFGNISSDAQGVATAYFAVDNITIAGLKNPIIGRGLIVHRDTDDGSQPTGNAGPRIAQGVIGVAK